MIALEQYEPFMGTYLHLKFDTISIQGLYFDYLGPDLIALDDLHERLDGPPRIKLRSPFDRVRVTFTGPWSTGCECFTSSSPEESVNPPLELLLP